VSALRLGFASWIIAVAVHAGACGDDGGGDASSSGSGGGAGTAPAGTGAGAGTRGGDDAGRGGSAGNASMRAGSGGSGSAGTAGEDASAGAGAGGSSGFTETGVCGQRGDFTVNASEFSGFEEYFIIGEEGFGEDICVVRFDVARAGDAPDGCMDPFGEGVACSWSHLVEFSNPTTVTDEDGVCADSEFAFDAARIAEIDGSQRAYGFVSEFAGHESVTMTYDEATETWKAFGAGTWDETAERFRFDRRDGTCDY
jgi:hypothetical protein